MVSIVNLKKEYKRINVVDIQSLTIAESESFGLVGNNGAGKTTLFRIILDLIPPSTGEVQINGINVKNSEGWKSFVGSYLDENFLINYLTPDEYFAFVGKLHQCSAEDMNLLLDRFRDLFNNEIIGTKKYIRDLSKGNLKKVGIAAAFIGQPKIIVLDEPFENLDPTSQIRLKEIIVEEYRERRTTFLISSHDLNHVTETCNRIVVMEKGQVIKDLAGDDQALAILENYFNK
jgi:ABC-2 type transport system ATP-binding protein